MALYYQDRIKTVEINCSSDIRRGYEKSSSLFIHKLYNGECGFNGNDDFPTHTDIPCYCCDKQFDTQPIPLPEEYNEQEKKWIYFGIFCSPHCVKGFLQNRNYSNLGDITILLKKMLVEEFNYKGHAVPTGSKFLSEKYGGDLPMEKLLFAAKQSKLILYYTKNFLAKDLAIELVRKQKQKNPGSKLISIEKEKSNVRSIKRVRAKKKNGSELKTKQYSELKSRKKSKFPSLSSSQKPVNTLTNYSDMFKTHSNVEEDVKLDNLDVKMKMNGTSNSSEILNIPPPPISNRNYINDINIESKDGTLHDNILPENIITANSESIGGWKIKDLKKPDEPIRVKVQDKFNSSGTDMYSEFIKKKEQDPDYTFPKKEKETTEKYKKKRKERLIDYEEEPKNQCKMSTLDAFISN